MRGITIACTLVALAIAACAVTSDLEVDDESSSSTSSGSGGSTSSTSSSDFGGGFNTGSTTDSGGMGTCEEISEEAENKVQPADIILAIDQSGSMDLETNWVKQQLNGFAQQITGSGIDVHVAVIAGKPGKENGFCVPAPLGSGNCPNDDVPPTFKHIDQHVGSSDALVQILNHYPNYKDMLRPGAQKHVIVISDDDSGLGAQSFDNQFKALDPQLANYVFHGIVSKEDDPGSLDCFFNPQPCCDVSADEGKVYKQLINMTAGVFGDLCQQDFQPVWNQVSTQVISKATLACEWDIPEPPKGQAFDPTKVNVEYSVNGGPMQPLGMVQSAAECANVNGGWYYDNPADPKKILVCPDVCTEIQNADPASMSIKFGCNTIPAPPK